MNQSIIAWLNWPRSYRMFDRHFFFFFFSKLNAVRMPKNECNAKIERTQQKWKQQKAYNQSDFVFVSFLLVVLYLPRNRANGSLILLLLLQLHRMRRAIKSSVSSVFIEF